MGPILFTDFYSTGPPSFSSNLQTTAMTQVPSTGIGSPNDLGLVPTAAGPQHPTKPTSLSPAPPPSNSGGGGGSGGEFQQTSYNGTELVMLYDYKVDLRLNLKKIRVRGHSIFNFIVYVQNSNGSKLSLHFSWSSDFSSLTSHVIPTVIVNGHYFSKNYIKIVNCKPNLKAIYS